MFKPTLFTFLSFFPPLKCFFRFPFKRDCNGRQAIKRSPPPNLQIAKRALFFFPLPRRIPFVRSNGRTFEVNCGFRSSSFPSQDETFYCGSGKRKIKSNKNIHFKRYIYFFWVTTIKIVTKLWYMCPIALERKQYRDSACYATKWGCKYKGDINGNGKKKSVNTSLKLEEKGK